MSLLRRQIPSANSLFVFEAAARTLSFTKAASEMNVTQPAVSRMVGKLETHLGTKLFIRTPIGLKLTGDGSQLYGAIRSGFQRIQTTIEELSAHRSDKRSVTLSLSIAIATHWFTPRLERLYADFPDIDLRFQLMTGEAVGPVDDVDLAIRLIRSEDSSDHKWLLVDEEIIPVCSKPYLSEHGSLDHVEDLGGHTLVHLSQPRVSWAEFLGQTGLPSPKTARSLTFSDYSVAIQSAANGQGIALGWSLVVAHGLLEGVLVPASSKHYTTGRKYFAIASRMQAAQAHVAAVRDWIVNETQLETEALKLKGI